MKAVALLVCLFGTALCLPVLPRRLFSGSASNELLLALALSNGGLFPPQLQVGRLSPGILQQPQIPGLTQIGFGQRVVPFGAQFPNQVVFPGQGLLPQNPGQGVQQNQLAQQQDPNNPQIPQQNQLPNHQNPTFINQRGFVPQQAAPVVPGAQQQQISSDVSAVGVPATQQSMPFGGVMPQFNGDRMNFAKAQSGGLMMQTTPITPSGDALRATPDPTADKANIMFMEP